jgi:hypothetical protein
MEQSEKVKEDKPGWSDNEDVNDREDEEAIGNNNTDLLGLDQEQIKPPFVVHKNKGGNQSESVEFRVGQTVDAFKIEPNSSGVGIWAKAIIVEESSISYRISFERDSEIYDQEVEKEFAELNLFPAGSKSSEEDEWRLQLKHLGGNGLVDYLVEGYGW